MYRVLLAAMAILFMASPTLANVLAVIDTRSQTMTVSKDGERLWIWKVSTGRPGYLTPSGTFHPTFLDPDHASSKYESAPMPWSVFFNGDVAIHGTIEVRNLGRAVSHGCVRLHPSHAEEFYQLVQGEGLRSVTIRVTSSGGSYNGAMATRRGFYRPVPRYPREPWFPAQPRYPAPFGWGWDF
jgi:L,D-transpeptidase catalytic domain